MPASIILGKETLTADPGVTIEKMMVSAGKHPDAFLYLFEGRPVPMTTVLEEDMKIDAIRVASGG
ncbi:MAG: hypothetical protein FWG58_01020 [Methanomassiliicoccaceae archaeon]|nr:hypothetical protein [Methanomassiliicoccaceae archaeon]